MNDRLKAPPKAMRPVSDDEWKAAMQDHLDGMAESMRRQFGMSEADIRKAAQQDQEARQSGQTGVSGSPTIPGSQD